MKIFAFLFVLEKCVRLLLGLCFSLMLVNSFSPQDYSQFELVGNVTAILSIFIAFGSHGFASKINVEHKFFAIFHKNFELRIKTLQLSVFSLALLVIYVAKTDFLIFTLLFCLSAIKSLSDLDRGILEANERGLLVLYSELGVFIVSTIVRCVLLAVSVRIEFIAFAYAVEGLVTVYLFRQLRNKQNFSKIINPTIGKFLFVSSTYWIFQVLSILYVKLEIFLISKRFSGNELALVAFSSKFVEPLAMFGLAFVIYYRKPMVLQDDYFWKRLSYRSFSLSVLTISAGLVGAIVTKVLILPFVSEFYGDIWILVMSYIPALVSVNVMQFLWIPIQKFNLEVYIVACTLIALGILFVFGLLLEARDVSWFLFALGCVKLVCILSIFVFFYYFSKIRVFKD